MNREMRKGVLTGEEGIHRSPFLRKKIEEEV